MNFEYDIEKSKSNKNKHGIDFEEAKQLWKDKSSLVIPAKTVNDEVRHTMISKLNKKCYISIFTFRNNKYRIISVRRCRKKEEQNYENHISKRI